MKTHSDNIFQAYAKLGLFAVLLLLLLEGCAAPESRVGNEFGQSVRQMVSGQIYDPETAANPSGDPPIGMDATKAAADVNRVYRRTDITKETIKAIASPASGGT